MLNEVNKKMFNYITNFKKILNEKQMNFNKIQNSFNELNQYSEYNEYNYLNNLLYPEKCKNVKIPSPIPVPSCSFQLHNSITLQTNSSGNLGIIFSPNFLASNVYKRVINVETTEWNDDYTIQFFTSLFVDNDDSLDGCSSNINWKIMDIGQNIPPIYDQYRLISSSLTVKYIGSLDKISGVIGGAIVYDESNEVGCHHRIKFYNKQTGIEYGPFARYTIPNYLAKYGNFDLAMDSFYHQENSCLEGIRLLYFPIDNSYLEYIGLFKEDYVSVKQQDAESYHQIRGIFTANNDYVKNTFKQIVYVLGAPGREYCFKLDIYCNFECLPTSEFMNYAPINISEGCCSMTNKIIKEVINIVQNRSITKASEEENEPPSIWQKLNN